MSLAKSLDTFTLNRSWLNKKWVERKQARSEKKEVTPFDLDTYDGDDVEYDVKLEPLIEKTHKSWHKLLKSLDYKKIEERISSDLAKTGTIVNMFPEKENIFRVFGMPLDNIKVVILGQDVYPNVDKKTDLPQAVGLCFSVPKEVDIPSSLKNIIKNLEKDPLIKFKKDKDTGGDISSWEKQGVFLLNCGLTCLEKRAGSHAKLWAPLTNDIISHIAKNTENVVFVLWGAFALDKEKIILESGKKHHVIKSSHPSGLSCNKPLKSYPAFKNCHFAGIVNKILKEKEKKEIEWSF